MVIPTPRLLLLALFGIIPVVLSGSYVVGLAVAIAWGALCAVLALVDVSLLPSNALLHWERDHEPKLSLATWNRIELRLRNRSNRALTLRVRDAVPDTMRPAGDSGQGVCLPGATWSLIYQVLPARRGDYRFGPPAVRYLGPLGLAWRQRAPRSDGEVKVYPNLMAVRSYESLLRRGRLEEIGLHASRRWGPGTEFERLREYTHDDEFRRINWPATARHHKPIAVDYQVERSQSVLLVLDAGRLMSAAILPGSEVPEVALSRLDYAVNASLLLAFVAQLAGDRVGLLSFADRVTRYLPPRAGRSGFLALTDALYNLAAESIESDFASGLGYLAARNPRRSLAVVFTDLAESEAMAPLVSHVVHLARRHLVLVVTLRDPALQRLALLPTDRSEHVYERAVARRTLDDRQQTLLTLRRQGVLTLDVSANALSASLINRYLEIKARGGL